MTKNKEKKELKDFDNEIEARQYFNEKPFDNPQENWEKDLKKWWKDMGLMCDARIAETFGGGEKFKYCNLCLESTIIRIRQLLSEEEANWMAEIHEQIKAERERVIKIVEELKIDEMGDGITIEAMADKFDVPDSVAAIQLLELKKDEILKSLK